MSITQKSFLFLAVLATALNGLMLMQYKINGFPTIIPNTESYLKNSVNAQTPQDKIKFSQLAISFSPMRALPYVNLALNESSNSGKISEKAVVALSKSYEIAPLSPLVSEARLSFIFQNWGQMPVNIRKSAIIEATNFARDYNGRKFIERLRAYSPQDISYILSTTIIRSQLVETINSAKPNTSR